MAGIFNLFSDISEGERGLLAKPMMRSKTFVEPNAVSFKSAGLSKPKGLSIRSNSELNILASPHTSNGKSDTNIKEQGLLKVRRTQLDHKGSPISPGKDLGTKKKEVVENKKLKLQKPNECCFRRPLPPRRRSKPTALPEPEKLSHYYDFESEFRNVSNIYLEKELKELLNQKQKIVKPFEDEGIESDPEPCASPNIPFMSLSLEFSDLTSKEVEIPDLPAISDDELLA